MDAYIRPLVTAFEENANLHDAPKMKAYMKNRFEFFGIKSPVRRKITKEFLSEYGEPGFEYIEAIVIDLFKQPQRELQYAAIELYGRTKKHWNEDTVSFFESMILTKSWWDSVDSINSICLRPYFLKFTDDRYKVSERWIDSDNIWLRRVSIIFQLRYKEKTDTELLSRNIIDLIDSNEFFVQKAIGWALRDYGFTDPEWVKSFVAKHKLKPLSKREALKRID